MTVALATPVVATLVAMEDAGFILGSYAITFAVVGAFAWRAVRHGRRLGAQLDDADKYWT